MIFIESQDRGWVNLDNVIVIRTTSIITDNWHGVKLNAIGIDGNMIPLLDFRDFNDLSNECQTTPEYENELILNALNAVIERLIKLVVCIDHSSIKHAVIKHDDIMQMYIDARKDQEIHT